MTIPLTGFRGVVRFKTWFGKFLEPHHPFPFGTFRPDYGSDPYNWQMLPSRHGGYWIRAWCSPGGFASESYYYWQTDMKDNERKVVLHPGADDWETFFIERHPMGAYALKSYGNNLLFVCAEPESHGIHLVANRPAPKEWEQFQIELVQEGLPGDPPAPVKSQMSFLCTNCGKQLALCEGGVPGQKCVYCSSPGGHCKCPFCLKEFYEIAHTHS